MRSKRSNRRRSRRREMTRRRSSKRVTNRRRRRSNQRVTNRRRRRSNKRVTNQRGKKRRSKKGRSGETSKELYYVRTGFTYQGVGMGASIAHNADPTNLVKIIKTNPGNVEIEVTEFSFEVPLNPNEIKHGTKSGTFIGTETALKAKLVPINSAKEFSKYFAVGEEYHDGGDTKTFFDTVWKSI